MTSLKCKHEENSSGSNQEKRSQCESSHHVRAHRQESKSTLWVQRAHFNSPLCAQHLPPSVFKVALYCPLLSTGLTCFSLDRPSSTYSTPAWPSITALFSLSLSASASPFSVFFFFPEPLSFASFNHIFHCSLLTKTPPPPPLPVRFSHHLSHKAQTCTLDSAAGAQIGRLMIAIQSILLPLSTFIMGHVRRVSAACFFLPRVCASKQALKALKVSSICYFIGM